MFLIAVSLSGARTMARDLIGRGGRGYGTAPNLPILAAAVRCLSQLCRGLPIAIAFFLLLLGGGETVGIGGGGTVDGSTKVSAVANRISGGRAQALAIATATGSICSGQVLPRLGTIAVYGRRTRKRNTAEVVRTKPVRAKVGQCAKAMETAAQETTKRGVELVYPGRYR